MLLLNKFKKLITPGKKPGTEKTRQLSDAFNVLIKHHKLAQLHEMLESGYAVNEENTNLFFEQLIHFKEADMKNYFPGLFKLFNSSIEQGVNNGTFERNSLYTIANKKDYMDSTFKAAINLKFLIGHTLMLKHFEEMNLTKKIEFSKRLEDLLWQIEQNYTSFYRIYIEAIDLPYFKEILKKLDTIISGGVADLLSTNLEASSVKALSRNVEEKLSPELVNLIKKIQTRVEDFTKSKIELGMQEQIVIKKIMNEDIPLMASNVALLPVDLQKNFINEEGQDVQGALLNLLKGYKDTIYGILDMAEEQKAQSVHKELKINTKYIDKVRQNNGQEALGQGTSETSETLRGRKTLSSST